MTFLRVFIAFLLGVYFCWIVVHRLEVSPRLDNGSAWAWLFFLFGFAIMMLSL